MQLISLNIIVKVIVLFNITGWFLSSVSKLTKPSALNYISGKVKYPSYRNNLNIKKKKIVNNLDIALYDLSLFKVINYSIFITI